MAEQPRTEPPIEPKNIQNTVTIALWMYDTIISTMHYAADNGGNPPVSTEVRRVIKQLETFRPN